MAAVILLSTAVFCVPLCHQAPPLPTHPAAAAQSRYAFLCLCCGMFGSQGLVSSPSRWSEADLMAPVFRCPGHSVPSRYERMKSFFVTEMLLLLELEMRCAQTFSLCHHCENAALKPHLSQHTTHAQACAHVRTAHTRSLTLTDWVIYWLRWGFLKQFAVECGGG